MISRLVQGSDAQAVFETVYRALDSDVMFYTGEDCSLVPACTLAFGLYPGMPKASFRYRQKFKPMPRILFPEESKSYFLKADWVVSPDLDTWEKMLEIYIKMKDWSPSSEINIVSEAGRPWQIVLGAFLLARRGITHVGWKMGRTTVPVQCFQIPGI